MSLSQPHLFGLVGHPVKHSLSPPMHKAAIEHIGSSGDYELVDLDADALSSGIAELKARGFSGFNVTIPHKQTLLSVCDQLTPDARKTRAVNTVKIENASQLIGHNTDLGGFSTALAAVLPEALRLKSACVVGAGGAARAAVWALIAGGWPRISIVARNPERARKLIDDVQTVAAQLESASQELYLPRFEHADTKATGLSNVPDLLVHCTSIGLGGEPMAEWLIDLLRIVNPEGVVFDMVYSRDGQPTPLVREANRLRLICCDGTDMLVHQAALAFEFWTGQAVPAQTMKQALEKARLSK